MRQILCFTFLLIMLIACSTQEEKAGSAAMEGLKEIYFLEDVELVSVEQERPRVVMLVYALDRLFNGKNYDVVVQSNETIPIEVEGTVNARKLEFKNNNYIQSKHQTYQEENKEYQEIITQLETFGVEEILLSDRYFDETTRTIHFRISWNGDDLSSDQFVNNLDKIAKLMVENMDTNISSQLTVQTKNLFLDEMRSDLVEIKLAPYGDHEYDKIIGLLDEQIDTVQSANRIDEELIKTFEQYNLKVTSSRLNDAEHDGTIKKGNGLYRHELEMNVLKDYELEDLLAGMQELRENGFNHSFVQLAFQQGSTDFCQVKRIQTIEDIEHCFTDIVYPAIQWED